jgi:hypothetical protein
VAHPKAKRFFPSLRETILRASRRRRSNPGIAAHTDWIAAPLRGSQWRRFLLFAACH